MKKYIKIFLIVFTLVVNFALSYDISKSQQNILNSKNSSELAFDDDYINELESFNSFDMFMDSFFVSTNFILGSIGLLMIALLIVLKTKKIG